MPACLGPLDRSGDRERLRLGTLITTVRLRHPASIDDQLDERAPDAAAKARFERIAIERVGRAARS